MSRTRKSWKLTVGAYGHMVTVCERHVGSPLYLRWWDGTKPNGGNWSWRGLRHRDQTRAEAQARELAGQLLSAIDTAHAGRVTVAELFARYEREVSAHKKGQQPAEDARRIALWQTFLGATRSVTALDFPTLDRFVRGRRAGTLEVWTMNDAGECTKRALSATPSDTTIGADLVFLNSVLNWGMRVALSDGSRLIESNPVRGCERPKNKDPKRPVATYDRFLKVRAKCDAADPQRLFGAFMDLVEALGWRVSATCALWASDLDRTTTATAPHGRLRKRGAVDKEGVEMWVPLSESARAAVDRAIATHPVVGDAPIFAMPSTPSDAPARAWTRYHARALLEGARRWRSSTRSTAATSIPTAVRGRRHGSICPRGMSQWLAAGAISARSRSVTSRWTSRRCSRL